MFLNLRFIELKKSVTDAIHIFSTTMLYHTISLTFEIISIFHKLSWKSSICHIDYVFRLESTMTKKKLLLDPDSFLIKFVCRKCIHRFIHTKQLDDLINEIKCSTKIEHTGKCVCSHVLSTLAIKGSG